MPGGVTYTGVRTVPGDEKTFIPKEPGAINGGMTQRSKDVPTPIITISVSSINEYVKKIKAAGCKAVKRKVEIPDLGFYAHIADSEGNVIGLWENLKKLRDKNNIKGMFGGSQKSRRKCLESSFSFVVLMNQNKTIVRREQA